MSLPVRKTPRANWHNDKGAEYFVTICTHNRVHYFGEVCNGKMQLTTVGECLKREIENTRHIRGENVDIPLYVIMPNHVHLVVFIDNGKDPLNVSANYQTDTGKYTDTRSVSIQRFGTQSKK